MAVNTVSDLLADHRKKVISTAADSRLNFKLNVIDNAYDVYNISAPFIRDKDVFLLGRVEARDSEHSHIGFFKPADSEAENIITDVSVDALPELLRKVAAVRNWIQTEGPDLRLQDPFVTVISGDLVIGGVEITEDESGCINYRTAFYKGSSIYTLERIFAGPWGMKDIRLKELEDGRVLLLTRPQGEVGGRGTIGWILLDSLSDLSMDVIKRAQLLTEQFLPEEWGGANEVHLLGGSLVGILSHIARFDEEGNRHYYASSFTLDYEKNLVSPMRIIAERKDFAAGESKREDLVDVIFSGGMLRLDNKEAALYCGAGDAEAHVRLIEDPFAYE